MTIHSDIAGSDPATSDLVDVESTSVSTPGCFRHEHLKTVESLPLPRVNNVYFYLRSNACKLGMASATFNLGDNHGHFPVNSGLDQRLPQGKDSD